MAPKTQKEISSQMAGLIAKALGSHAEHIECDIPMSKLGLDSVMVIELSKELEDWLQTEVDPTIAWDHPTINAMASYLAKQVRG